MDAKADEPLFLNNALLTNGHAIRKDDFTLGDWDKDVMPVPK